MNGAEPLGNRVNPKAWSDAKRRALVVDFSDIPTGPPTMHISIENGLRSIDSRSRLLCEVFGQQKLFRFQVRNRPEPLVVRRRQVRRPRGSGVRSVMDRCTSSSLACMTGSRSIHQRGKERFQQRLLFIRTGQVLFQ